MKRRPTVVPRADVEPVAVGASEVGAVLGCDPWTTPLQLYRRKLGLDEPRADSEAMRLGRALEGPVVAIARERIPLRIRRNRRTYLAPFAPLFATPDAFVDRDRLLEAKVVGIHSPELYADELPCRVRLQVQSQLVVTGRDAAYVAQLVGTELRLQLVHADPDVQVGLLEAVVAFVEEHVLPEIPPDPLTYDERWSDLLERLQDAPAVDVLAGQDVQDAGDRLLEIRAEEKRLEDETKTLRLELLDALEAGAGTRLVAGSWTGSLQDSAGRVDWRSVAGELGAVVESSTLADIIGRHTGDPSRTFVVRSYRGK